MPLLRTKVHKILMSTEHQELYDVMDSKWSDYVFLVDMSIIDFYVADK